MNDKYQYRLSKNQKVEIAQNLIDILQKDLEITNQTRGFIIEWCRTDASEKRKAFFDVWDIVLKNYLPTTRPILFRACERLSKNGKIASFTRRLECARRFSKGKGSLIICDTEEALQLEEKYYQRGEFKHTFYPLTSVLGKAKAKGGCGFTERFLNEFIGEDEYIMKINFGNMHSLKWIKNDF
ncbi:MAG TPA: hypothetical protein PKC55_08105 [Dysgonomonas sp.]|uniref:hypothetical protein n=1 Tax=unclassified Dysgonomonas TaxID=2630389 RepID=UPI0025C4197C|nr:MULTISPECIES: hypothetical protein [unclassified Dysgonomonas]HML64773.1 hypothetical protein [Dysgonomonas sp.]